MSELIVFSFDGPAQARAAYDEALAASDFITELQGAAVVTVDAQGKTHVETPPRWWAWGPGWVPCGGC